MCGILLCLSVAVTGVDYGWQPVAGGGIEYIIQIEPQLLDSMKAGHDVFSDLPASVRAVRSYRITVGSGRLPHHGEPPPESAVVPAGGPATEQAADEAADQPPSEIDLSQLPGPVLGPAFPGDPPALAKGDEEEPPRLAEAEASDAAEPIANRVVGYHGDPDRQQANKPPIQNNPDQQNPIQQSDEPQSPSDREPVAATTASVKPALVQLGLLASLGCNAFLLWVATGQRSRYRALLRRMFDGMAGREPSAMLGQDVSPPRWERLPAADKGETTGASGSASP
jgi:hypothetical protein